MEEDIKVELEEEKEPEQIDVGVDLVKHIQEHKMLSYVNLKNINLTVNTPGSVIGSVAIYNKNGLLVGYIPLYNSIT